MPGRGGKAKRVSIGGRGGDAAAAAGAACSSLHHPGQGGHRFVDQVFSSDAGTVSSVFYCELSVSCGWLLLYATTTLNPVDTGSFPLDVNASVSLYCTKVVRSP